MTIVIQLQMGRESRIQVNMNYLGCRSSLVLICKVVTKMVDNDLGLNLYVVPTTYCVVLERVGVQEVQKRKQVARV